MILTILLLISPIWAAEPCPVSESTLPVDRSALQAQTARVFEGYRARDNRVVQAARCEVEGAVPRLAEALSPSDVARLHLSYAAAALMAGEPDGVVMAYLVAARASDSNTDAVVEGLFDEGDPLLTRYRSLLPSGDAAGLIAAYNDPAAPLPAAWRGTVQVNGGQAASTRNGPYFLQVSGASMTSAYVLPVGATLTEVPYARLRPVQLKLVGASGALTVAAFGAGAAFAVRYHQNETWEPEGSGTMSGVAVADSVGRWEEQQQLRRQANHALLGTAVGFGVVTAGLGVWAVRTF